MSVVSKIFIIVNLLLTLLLLAAMGRKIDYSFKGLYLQQYKRENEGLREADQSLKDLVANRVEQVKKLREQEKEANSRLGKIKGLKGTSESQLNSRKQQIKEQKDAKNDLKRQIAAKVSEGQGLNREEKSLQEQLKQAKADITEAIATMKRAKNSYHATKRTAEDLKAALEASQ